MLRRRYEHVCCWIANHLPSGVVYAVGARVFHESEYARSRGVQRPFTTSGIRGVSLSQEFSRYRKGRA